ncbi:unnamed protein product [Penicillium salamii]|uniref:mitogen-activated protein kinase n=1 Tax=Penicillium salamii TaxID=1612424 RepID=A0A9W4N153_9EURO|nr:unnamed protein product [Penicillium salamii]CAG7994524.1 unnamed protein product [Penicillium salamii]CAG8129441.1 unnamed protein product [Penicillium salamii]CAG8140108.1 unnamed protein product [Penicillium salamii]CAG8218868.1 unnamed protein product [Penicillium salamii]
MQDIFVSPLDDLYIVTDLVSTDLRRVIETKPLEDRYIQYFFYQIVRALKYVHSAGVVHRDLKPSNILINENCDLKLCDFGLARALDQSMTGYVTTRFYRAPETILSWKTYGVEADMWSAGCVIAEMINGKPLFPGRNQTDQFLVIHDILGSVPPDFLPAISSKKTLEHIESLPFREKRPLKDRLKDASFNALDMLESLLTWNPSQRISAVTALSYPYLSRYHDPADEPAASAPLNWALIDCDHSLGTWKWMMSV